MSNLSSRIWNSKSKFTAAVSAGIALLAFGPAIAFHLSYAYKPLADITALEDDASWLKAGMNPSQEQLRGRSRRSMPAPKDAQEE
mmetsp:Transcript_25255/g.64191  ORF Transcript_25255/g.64191 Transcript_25255/m.64191 type:complete len:85 (-) Transcript_25255:559-813(-)|eukprot:CAMPEP_0202868402 /NCGR_PEP_ID=MMETSP1391-20130828/10861_1 /ASSEMBLY_ACC=CAM_ASM_000867 /TAXON_ID=1034604 /ORGANISM="Chlamydomonas leiostraca, Strain SAG 11-49" /LENGTH=84 /DNA_ID=CAMNT_0049548575 /DNA_START=167 /DNA_END=421 /DNA_ORIENTATION=-